MPFYNKFYLSTHCEIAIFFLPGSYMGKAIILNKPSLKNVDMKDVDLG